MKAPATDLEDVGIKLALKNTQLGLGRVCVRGDVLVWNFPEQPGAATFLRVSDCPLANVT